MTTPSAFHYSPHVSVAGYSLPPMSAYVDLVARLHPSPIGDNPTPAQYRRLSAMIRSGASLDEKVRAVGKSAASINKMQHRLREAGL